MARIQGVELHQASLFVRFVYWLVRRTMRAIAGKPSVVEPIRIMAHHTRLLRAYGQMEQGQAAANTVPVTLKSLASLQSAMLIGCPF